MILLSPLSWIYGAALTARNLSFAAGMASRWAMPVPVISVGNLTLGGTSKTPMVLWLLEHLLASGAHPGVALRGYGGSYEGGCERVSSAGQRGDAGRWGDEAQMIAGRFPGVPVVVGRKRSLAALDLVSSAGVDVVVLDDGFQHRALERHLDIVMLDSASPLGNGRLLPAGPLRERPSALRRARVMVLSRWSESSDGMRRTSEARLRDLAPGAAFARCSLEPTGLWSRGDCQVPAGDVAHAGCLAFCGIARPTSFRRQLSRLGVEPLALRAFRDHHRYTSLELEALEAEALRRKAGWLVTTEKDQARLDGWRPRIAELGFLRVELRVEPEEVILEPLRSLLRTGVPS